MQKRSAITTLIFAKLCRIHEEAIVAREERVHVMSPLRKFQCIGIREEQRLIGRLRAEILAELVPEVGACIALREYRRRRVAVDRAMIGRQQHRDLSSRRLAQQGQQRRPLEPLTRETAQRNLVTRYFIKDLRLATTVRQQIDKIEHESAHTLRRDRRPHVTREVVRSGRCRDLLVPHMGLATQLPEMRLQKLALVRVERLIVLRSPPLRETRRDLAWKESAEQRVP